ncbi:hypothetical protein [Streptomyces werraensis]|uniref:hypothetical protein n=1 Tax=Streptomyces werraensis TaxID=68284 RepID=UPI003700F688
MRFTPDLHNNVGRMCAIRGLDYARVWKLRTAMRSSDPTKQYYLCRNVVTGKYRAFSTDQMSALY